MRSISPQRTKKSCKVTGLIDSKTEKFGETEIALYKYNLYLKYSLLFAGSVHIYQLPPAGHFLKFKVFNGSGIVRYQRYVLFVQRFAGAQQTILVYKLTVYRQLQVIVKERRKIFAGNGLHSTVSKAFFDPQ